MYSANVDGIEWRTQYFIRGLAKFIPVSSGTGYRHTYREKQHVNKIKYSFPYSSGGNGLLVSTAALSNGKYDAVVNGCV